MRQEIFLSLSGEIKTQIMNTQELKERKFEEKIREKRRVSSFSIYIVVFTFSLKVAPKLLSLSSFIWKLSSSSLLNRHKNSHRRCYIKKDFLKNCAIVTGRHLCWSHFLMAAGLKTYNVIKKRLIHRCFLWIVRNFKEQQFWRTSANGSYCRQFCNFSFIVFSFYV